MSEIRKVRLFRTATAFWSRVIVLGGMMFQTAMGHAQNAKPNGFEVASIRRNTSASPDVRLNPPLGGRFRAVNVTVRMLIMRAYRMKDYQIAGGPAWLNSERYDITAAAAEPNIDETKYQTLLRSLLADRFQVKLHHDSRNMGVYDLVVENSGLKLPEKELSCIERDSKPPAPVRGQPAPTLCGGVLMDGSHLEGRRISMAQLVNALANMLGRPVIDKTDYKGSFDVHLEFSPEGIAPGSGGGFGAPGLTVASNDSDSAQPSLFTAIQQKMGLKLQSDKGPVEILVINRAEKPSSN